MIYQALRAGLQLEDALHMPLSLLEDIVAAGWIITDGWERIPTDPEDIEADFQKTMSRK